MGCAHGREDNVRAGETGAAAAREKSNARSGADEPHPYENRTASRVRACPVGRSLEFGVWGLEFEGCGSIFARFVLLYWWIAHFRENFEQEDRGVREAMVSTSPRSPRPSCLIRGGILWLRLRRAMPLCGQLPPRCGLPAFCGVIRDDGQVGRGQIERGEFAGSEPADGHVLVRVRWGAARCEPADERKHLNRHGAVVVREDWQRPDDRNRAAEFLVDFADQCGGRFFTGFNLSAGEFPFQPEVLVRRPLGDEHLPESVLDHGTDDRNGFRHGSSGVRRLASRKRGSVPGTRRLTSERCS